MYELKPAPRTPAEVLASTAEKTLSAPKAKRKWLTASVIEDAAEVIADVFDEARRRDPNHERTWVALLRFVDHLAHDRGSVADDACAQPLALGLGRWQRLLLGACKHLLGGAQRGLDLVHRADLGDPLSVWLLAA